jgi:hypothetical protein
MTFLPYGLWSKSERTRFFSPRNPAHVSHSIVNLQRTNSWFEADCRSLRDLMHTLGHERIDLLKLDIEGAEYDVLDSLVSECIPVGILCVEFDEGHHPKDWGYIGRIRRAVGKLRSVGFSLVSVEGWNLTFLKE